MEKARPGRRANRAEARRALGFALSPRQFAAVRDEAELSDETPAMSRNCSR